jgi:hypothetical protein
MDSLAIRQFRMTFQSLIVSSIYLMFAPTIFSKYSLFQLELVEACEMQEQYEIFMHLLL